MGGGGQKPGEIHVKRILSGESSLDNEMLLVAQQSTWYGLNKAIHWNSGTHVVWRDNFRARWMGSIAR